MYRPTATSSILSGLLATAAVQNLLGGDEAMSRARRPELYIIRSDRPQRPHGS
ncbi:MAG TPA: hypothetical protein VGH27_26435 [Streptosporangiaceae bacterium]